jgi:hypothetical protein
MKIITIYKSFLCFLASAFTLLSAQAQVSYIEYSWDAQKKELHEETKTANNCFEITGQKPDDWQGLGNGWFVVRGNVSRQVFNVIGDAHLILTDGCTMSAKQLKIDASSNGKLHIYAQSKGNTCGTIDIYNDKYKLDAAIGSPKDHDMGSLYIHGGYIKARHFVNFECGAGIGGGLNGKIAENCEVVIYGGEVDVQGADRAAGIGGGLKGSQGGPITIYGGKVTARSPIQGAGIGSGSGADDILNNGMVIASNFTPEGGVVTVWGGQVWAYGGYSKTPRENDLNYCIPSGAGIGGGQFSKAGKVYVHGGSVYAFSSYSSAAIGGSNSKPGGLLEMTGGEVKIWRQGEQNYPAGPGIGGGWQGEGGQVIIKGGLLDVRTRHGYNFKSAPIGAGSIRGGHLLDDGKLELGDHMCVARVVDSNYSDDPYSESVSNYLVTADQRSATVSSHEQTHIQIYACTHGGFTYSYKDENSHVRHCSYCNYTDEEQHTTSADKDCPCGKKAGASSPYWRVTLYTTADGKTYTSEEYMVIKELSLLLPTPPAVSGVTFMGWLPAATAPASIEMLDNEKSDDLEVSGLLVSDGTTVKPTADMAYYARYRYDYTDVWTWNDNYTEATVTISNAITGETKTLQGTATEDERARYEPKEEGELGEAHYMATATYQKATGLTYQFEDWQRVTLYKPRTITLDASGTTEDQEALLGKYEGLRVNVTINNLTIKKDGKLHPICLPFYSDLKNTPLDGATLYKFSKSELNDHTAILDFEQATSIQSGEPYFYRFATNGTPVENPEFTDVTVDDYGAGIIDDQYAEFIGTFEPLGSDKTSDYLIFDNSGFLPTASAVSGYSTFFYASCAEEADGSRTVRSLTLRFGSETFTQKITYSWDGTGAEDTPYLIKTIAQLIELQEAYSSNGAEALKGKYFRQADNIKFDQTQKNNFTPIFNFTGHYDGDGYFISGLNIDTDYENGVALFGNMTDAASVSNVILGSSSIKGTNAAPIAVSLEGTSVIENCHVLDGVKVEASKYYAGGLIVHTNSGTPVLRNCSSQAEVVAHLSYSGGIVGLLNAGTVENCLYLGQSVSTGTDMKAYAIIGQKTDGTVNDCYYTATTLTDAYGMLMPQDAKANTLFLSLLKQRDTFLKTSKTELADTHISYSLTLNGRTLYRDNTWNTLCLPFSLTAAQLNADGSPLKGADIRDLSSSSFSEGTLTLNFQSATAITAGRPCLVKWQNNGDGNVDSPTFSGVTVGSSEAQAVETASVNFLGGFAPVSLQANDRTVLFLGAGNTLYYPNADMTIGSFRAYFKLLNGLTAGDISSAVKLEFDEQTTAIVNVNPNANPNANNIWYTLDGQRIEAPAKGLYIHNGKKVLIK